MNTETWIPWMIGVCFVGCIALLILLLSYSRDWERKCLLAGGHVVTIESSKHCISELKFIEIDHAE